MRARKLGYYARALVSLSRIAKPASLAGVLARGRGRLELRDGVLEVSSRLDLLVLAETAIYDVYRLRALRSPRLVVDVGASVGDFALAAARRFPDCRVLALEPNPSLYSLLTQNIRRNNVRNVIPRRCAAGTSARATLWSPPAAALASTSHAPANAAPIAVESSRLDELVGDAEVDLLKIDCEGAELDVLDSLGARIGQVRRVALEFHDWHSEVSVAAAERLRSAGFDVGSTCDPFDSQIGMLYAGRSR